MFVNVKFTIALDDQRKQITTENIFFPFSSPLARLCDIGASVRDLRTPVASDNQEFCDELIYLQTYCR